MRSTVKLMTGPGFEIRTVRCEDDRTGWSEPESYPGYAVVLVSRGRFRRRVAGRVDDVDPTVAYLSLPGDEEHFAHPAGGDVCTSVTVAPWLWRGIAGDAPGVVRRAVYVDARIDLAHRRIVRAAEGEFAGEELLRLLAAAVRQVVAGAVPATDGSAAAGRSLVAAAREAVLSGHPAAAGLVPLAALLRVSPYRLSRAFTRELGVSLTRYRNRVRVGAALDRLAGGERDLAGLAADLGFADQAHLCRTVRAQTGDSPTTLRRLLAPRGPG